MRCCTHIPRTQTIFMLLGIIILMAALLRPRSVPAAKMHRHQHFLFTQLMPRERMWRWSGVGDAVCGRGGGLVGGASEGVERNGSGADLARAAWRYFPAYRFHLQDPQRCYEPWKDVPSTRHLADALRESGPGAGCGVPHVTSFGVTRNGVILAEPRARVHKLAPLQFDGCSVPSLVLSFAEPVDYDGWSLPFCFPPPLSLSPICRLPSSLGSSSSLDAHVPRTSLGLDSLRGHGWSCS